MSISGIKGNIGGGNIGGVSQADINRQLELEGPAKQGNLAGLAVRQVQPPTESPINSISRKGEGVNAVGLGDGAAGARRLAGTIDPAGVKDAGETGAAKSAASATDSVAQIMAKVVELQKQLTRQTEQKPQGIK